MTLIMTLTDKLMSVTTAALRKKRTAKKTDSPKVSDTVSSFPKNALNISVHAKALLSAENEAAREQAPEAAFVKALFDWFADE
ncbi:MAG: hypothetical protein Q4D40_02090 [Eubacteriales bacterium]|nr:hypothetical protein [Eubacteriales bacterium]